MITSMKPTRSRISAIFASLALLLQVSWNSAKSAAGLVRVPPVQVAADEIVNPLRGNVVAVRRKGSGDSVVAAGFGFIVGERGNRLYIVTANHVARNTDGNREPDRSRGVAVREALEVMFYMSDDRWQHANLLEHFAAKPQDLAVIETPLPSGFTWKRNCAADIHSLIAMSPSKNIRGLPAVFIGRQTDVKNLWFVPSAPGSIGGNPNTSSLLSFEITTVLSGTSGAPVVTPDGIIGMILQDEGGGVARALSIDFIQRALAEWQYEWSLLPSAPPQSTSIPKIISAQAQLLPMGINRNTALLMVFGSGFGSSADVEVWVNGKDVSGKIWQQNEGALSLRGDQGTLNLSKGENKVFVRVRSAQSNTYTFVLR